MPDRSDIESFLTDISNRVTRPEESTMPPVETKPEPTAPPDTEEPGTAAPENNAPAAAIGFGSLRSPALPNAGAINIDRTVYYSKMFGEGDIQTKLLSLIHI